MGKAPAFQFYVRDWLSDPELQSASSSSRGIWVNALCFMWEARERGKIEGTVETLSRLLNCTEEEFNRFLSESDKFHFNDLDKNINGHVTLINRRMYRDERERKLHLERQDRYRQKQKTQDSDVKSDADVTTPSSSSSSSSSSNINSKEGEDAPFKLPSKEEIKEASDVKIIEQVEKVSRHLYEEKIFPEVNAFKNKMLKEKKNPRSILHTLCRAYLKKEFEEGPWAYCLEIIKIESAKYSARDYRKTIQ